MFQQNLKIVTIKSSFESEQWPETYQRSTENKNVYTNRRYSYVLSQKHFNWIS